MPLIFFFFVADKPASRDAPFFKKNRYNKVCAARNFINQTVSMESSSSEEEGDTEEESESGEEPTEEEEQARAKSLMEEALEEEAHMASRKVRAEKQPAGSISEQSQPPESLSDKKPLTQILTHLQPDDVSRVLLVGRRLHSDDVRGIIAELTQMTQST